MKSKLPPYEYYSHEVFNNTVIDIIMNIDNITEQKAIDKYNTLWNELNINSQECQIEDGTGASIRKGIWNLLIKYDYVAF